MVRHIMLKLRVLNLRIVLPILGLPEIEHCIFFIVDLIPFVVVSDIAGKFLSKASANYIFFFFSLCKILINIDFIMLEYDALAF